MSAPLGILMVVSPGEQALAADSLRRALACAPAPCEVALVDNGGLGDATAWWSQLEAGAHRLRVIAPAGAPRPYFEIARTVFGALAMLAANPPALVFKIDPDTLVLDGDFFSDVQQLEKETRADFYACHVRVAHRDHRRRTLRLVADLLPVGVARRPAANRYGRGLRPRFGAVWYARPAWAALRRRELGSPLQPSGGFYALRGAAITALAARSFLATRGANGLEWNDDTLLPIAVRASGGAICDLRATRFASGWGWLHGSRYFTNEQGLAPGLRALHPVKLAAADQALRALLDRRPRTTP